MGTSRLKSSVIATVAGGTLVLAAFAANSMTNPAPELGQKGDRLQISTVACGADCMNLEKRIAMAFETVAEHDEEAGTTTLTRIRVSE